MSTPNTNIVHFPAKNVEVAEDAWIDELVELVKEGTETGNVDSFISFTIMKGVESGVHVGCINVDGQIGAYMLIGALEGMKRRILDSISPQS